jgi:hypothetical protein
MWHHITKQLVPHFFDTDGLIFQGLQDILTPKDGTTLFLKTAGTNKPGDLTPHSRRMET